MTKRRAGFVRMEHLPFFMAVAELAFGVQIAAMKRSASDEPA